MTLRQDCELWATFDAEDVDAQRGIVRDRSGQGRTLEASGGPTYGQASPVGEAVAFDGTDDFFTVPFSPSNGAFTVASVALQDDRIATERDLIANLGTNRGFEFGDNSAPEPTTKLEIKDGSGSTAQSAVGSRTEEFIVHIGRFDGDTLSVQNSTGAVDTTQVPFTPDISIGGVRVGSNGSTGGRLWGGKIAFLAFWSRALSNGEIEELNRMTDRMVSRL